jgi:hypothetical protein
MEEKNSKLKRVERRSSEDAQLRSRLMKSAHLRPTKHAGVDPQVTRDGPGMSRKSPAMTREAPTRPAKLVVSTS